MPVPVETVDYARMAALLGAGICMGFGALGPALGQGITGAKACEAISKNPSEAGMIMRTMMAAMGFTESSAVYCFVIAILLIMLGRS